MLLSHWQTAGGRRPADADVARSLAAGAGKLLLALRSDRSMGSPGHEQLGHEQLGHEQLGHKQLGHEADKRSQEYLNNALRQARPADAVLSEEAADDTSRLLADRVWIIDPLDGTREYSEGRQDWAVHVALWSAGELVAGAVALPSLDLVFSSDRRPDQRADRWADQASAHTPLRIAVSRSRPPEIAKAVSAELGARLIPMGSAGYKVCAVVTGEVDAYLHDGGQYEWDSAAPVAVARAAGLHASRIDGAQLRYNQPNSYLPDLLVCRPELSGELLRLIQDAPTHGRLESRGLLQRNAGE